MGALLYLRTQGNLEAPVQVRSVPAVCWWGRRGALPHSLQGPAQLSVAWLGLRPDDYIQSDMARQSHKTRAPGPRTRWTAHLFSTTWGPGDSLCLATF